MLIEDIILADWPFFALDWATWENPHQVCLQLHLTQPEAKCPTCGGLSQRIHSTYLRHLADLALLPTIEHRPYF